MSSGTNAAAKRFDQHVKAANLPADAEVPALVAVFRRAKDRERR